MSTLQIVQLVGVIIATALVAVAWVCCLIAEWRK